jgi:hypothetical protein
MGQANYGIFNKGKKVWVTGFLEKKHCANILGQNSLKLVRDEPLHWDTAVTDVLATFKNWLLMFNFHNAEWSHHQWVEMCLRNVQMKFER